VLDVDPSSIDDDWSDVTRSGNAVCVAIGIETTGPPARVLEELPLHEWLCYRPKARSVA
jgi:hypothetical protein